ncbi:uncharacterized protein [Mytilus edulis]|uniref:Uncharacterized protein n=1 Tax=Mytilus galloprovincialis TaxID=29158 RepID=A0A8B6FN32_MYTGA|nr:Hypothetical predicted protein [Mytilus galloprovincialis]
MPNILMVLKSKWFFMVILLLILPRPAVSISEEIREAVTSGLEIGKEIGELLSNKQFTSSLAKIAKGIGPYLGALGPFVGIVLAFIPIESEELSFMKDMMKNIDNRLDQVDNRFNDIERLIKWNVVQVNFGQIEQRIKAVSREFEHIYNVPETAVQNQKELYIWSYKSDYQNSGTKLYQAIVLKQGTFQEDLGTSVLRYTKNYCYKTRIFLTGVMQLLLQAVKVELGFLSVINFTENADYFKLDWENRIQEVREKFEQIEKQCRFNYYLQSGKDIDEYSSKNKGLTHDQFANGLYDHLSIKYYWRNWAVISYDPIGDDKHWAEVSGGYIKLRKNGRNIVVASVERSHPVMDLERAKTKMYKVPVTQRGGSWWTGYRRVGRRAVDICNSLDNKEASLVSVITMSAHRAYAYPNYRWRRVSRIPYYDISVFG